MKADHDIKFGCDSSCECAFAAFGQRIIEKEPLVARSFNGGRKRVENKVVIDNDHARNLFRFTALAFEEMECTLCQRSAQGGTKINKNSFQCFRV